MNVETKTNKEVGNSWNVPSFRIIASGGSRISQSEDANPKNWAPTYYLVNFSRKLQNENKRI